MGTLNAPAMPLPGELKVRVAAIPGVRSGHHLFCARRQSADESLGQKCVATLHRVMFKPHMNSETLRKKNVGCNTMYIPCVPSPGKSPLHLLIGWLSGG